MGNPSCFHNTGYSPPSIDLYTDASGTLGYGAVLGPQWLFGRWNDVCRGQSIRLLEFYPIVLAVSVWADSLSNKCISSHSDNRAAVDIINSQTFKDTKVMHLMRKLVLSCLRHNILSQHCRADPACRRTTGFSFSPRYPSCVQT